MTTVHASSTAGCCMAFVVHVMPSEANVTSGVITGVLVARQY